MSPAQSCLYLSVRELNLTHHIACMEECYKCPLLNAFIGESSICPYQESVARVMCPTQAVFSGDKEVCPPWLPVGEMPSPPEAMCLGES
jgi:hypothetical protein